MFFKITEAIKGLKQLPHVIDAIRDEISFQYSLIKIYFRNRRLKNGFGKYLSCSFDTVSSYYRNVGCVHLEFFAHNGIFIASSPSLSRIYPIILVADTNIKSFNTAEAVLSSSLSTISLVDISPEQIIQQNLSLDKKLNSIGLPFVLETLNSIEEVEQFLIHIKSLLSTTDSIIFGATAIYNLGPKKKINKYINYLNKNKMKFNKSFTVEQLLSIFETHFHNITYYIKGSCLLFSLEPQLEVIKRTPILPKSDPLDIPFYKEFR